jgi:hypothetical protein
VFSHAFDQFQRFFLIKTGLPWAQRLLARAGADKRLFRYTPPVGSSRTLEVKGKEANVGCV